MEAGNARASLSIARYPCRRTNESGFRVFAPANPATVSHLAGFAEFDRRSSYGLCPAVPGLSMEHTPK